MLEMSDIPVRLYATMRVPFDQSSSQNIYIVPLSHTSQAN